MSEAGDIRKTAFKIGAFIVKPDRNLLTKDGESYSLEPRIMDVLCELAAQPRTVITRQNLIDRVWKVEYGADESLTRAISLLRKTFKSAGAGEEFIQTIPKRGYRLAQDVYAVSAQNAPTLALAQEPVDVPKDDTAPAPEAVLPTQDVAAPPLVKPEKRRSRKAAWVSLIALVSLVIIALLFWQNSKKAFGTSLAISEYGRSVAVLSFADMSPAGDQEYFSDGLAEELLSGLAQMPDLRVVGRTSSFAYKGQRIGLSEIGNALNVSHLIDGSVRKQGDQVRVSMQLINVADGAQIWSKTYDGTLGNVFALQERISRDVMTELSLVLGLSVVPTIDIDLD